MLACLHSGGCAAACSRSQHAPHPSRVCSVTPCRKRGKLVAMSYRETSSPPGAARCITPASDMHAVEQAIKTLGQAYMMNSWHRQLNARLGKEQEVFAGLSRMMLDKFSDAPVLYITQCGNAAAIVLSNEQQASIIQSLQAMDFSIIHGSLQMLVAMPEDSMPKVAADLEKTYTSSLSAVLEAGAKGTYQQIMLIGTQPSEQSKGLGSALMKAILYEAERQQQPLVVQMPDESSTKFYAKFGFKVIGHSKELQPIMMRASSQAAGQI